MKRTDYYIVASVRFAVEGEDLPAAVHALSGFPVFAAEEGQTAFSFVQNDIVPVLSEGKLLFELFHDGCMMRFYSHSEGHSLRLSKESSELILWRTEPGRVYLDGSFDPQMLKFALWIGYGLETIALRRICMHCSCIVSDSNAYLFLGESGTGKSTHTRLWRENIEGAFLLNDDSPILSFEDGKVWIYGSPWSGKTPCYKQERYPLGGCVRLSQAPFNEIVRLSSLRAFAALHPSCPPQFAMDERLYDEISQTLGEILGRTAVWHLKCLPDAAAAVLSHETITKE